MRVIHPEFGEGNVISEKDGILFVLFDNYGEKAVGKNTVSELVFGI